MSCGEVISRIGMFDIVQKIQKIAPAVNFFYGFLRNPSTVGSVIPSSRYLERRIIDACRLANAEYVVELGPGTGGTTKALLENMPTNSKLLTIDLDEKFVDLVKGIDDSRLIVHQGSAEDLEKILRQYNLPKPDVVVSGIPFSTMTRECGNRIAKAIRTSLKPGGSFVAYQFRSDVAKILNEELGAYSANEIELLNIPPMRVYKWSACSSKRA